LQQPETSGLHFTLILIQVEKTKDAGAGRGFHKQDTFRGGIRCPGWELRFVALGLDEWDALRTPWAPWGETFPSAPKRPRRSPRARCLAQNGQMVKCVTRKQRTRNAKSGCRWGEKNSCNYLKLEFCQ